VSAWLFLGAGLGLLLEAAGFGSARKLVAVFHRKDAQILRVLPTAIVTAVLGILLLDLLGRETSAYFTPRSQYLAQAVGGLVLGLGFYVGGFCPGTAVVGLFSGHLDALGFLAGLVAGWYAWDAWGSLLDPIVHPVPLGRDTLPEVLGADPRLVSAAVVVAGGALLGWFAWRERRY